MAARETIFITGITGTLGSELALKAIQSNMDVVALVRGESDQAAFQRVEQALSTICPKMLKRHVKVLRGGLSELNLSLANSTAELSNITRVLHCAASIELDDRDRERSYQSNVEGTRNVLELCSQIKAPLVYLSTAYVAGKRRGIVLEDELDIGQSFNNVYEKTKLEAESLVRAWSKENSSPVVILRPSIVVGSSIDGRIIKFSALYDFMRVFDSVLPRLKSEEIRIVGRGATTENFVPLDYFTEAAWHIVQHNRNGVFHITNPAPVTLEELRQIFARLFSVDCIKFIEEEEFSKRPPTQAEQLCRRAFQIYTTYMNEEPLFDRSNTDRALSQSSISLPRMDFHFYQRLYTYAKKRCWKKGGTNPGDTTQSVSGEIKRYFGEFLSGKLHQQFLPDLQNFTALFQVHVRELPAGRWTLSVANGVLESVAPNGAGAKCVFVVDTDTFFEVVSGKKSPQQSFFEKRVEIEGDIETGLRVAAVLASFFQMFPYETAQ